MTIEEFLDQRKMLVLSLMIGDKWACEVLDLALWALLHQRDAADCDMESYEDWTRLADSKLDDEAPLAHLRQDQACMNELRDD